MRISPDRAEVDRLFDVLEFAQLRTRILAAIATGQTDDDDDAAEQAADSGESVIRPVVSVAASPADVAALVNGAKVLDIAATWSGDAVVPHSKDSQLLLARRMRPYGFQLTCWQLLRCFRPFRNTTMFGRISQKNSSGHFSNLVVTFPG